MKKRTALVLGFIALCLVSALAEDIQDGEKKAAEKPAVVDKAKLDRDVELGVALKTSFADGAFSAEVDGSLDFSAEYDKAYLVTLSLETEDSKVSAGEALLGARLGRLDLRAGFGSARFYADALVKSADRPLLGKSLAGATLDDLGYADSAAFVSLGFDSPRGNPIKAADVRVSWDGDLPVLVSGGLAFRLSGKDSWAGVAGTVAVPSGDGYGMLVARVEPKPLVIALNVGAGNYLTALDSLAIDGVLYTNPIWAYADCSLGLRLGSEAKPVDLWVIGSAFLPTFSASTSVDGALLGCARVGINGNMVALRLAAGADYGYASGTVTIAPDFRLACAIEM